MRADRKFFTAPLAVMLVLGALSGVATAQFPFDDSKYKLFEVPVAPGLIFGGVLAFGCVQWGYARWKAIATVLLTTAAWIAPVRLFMELVDPIGPYAAGLTAGALGAAGSAFGVAVAISAMRRPQPFLVVVAAGAAAGLLVNIVSEPIILFVIWQGVVAAAIGATFSAPAESSASTDKQPAIG